MSIHDRPRLMRHMHPHNRELTWSQAVTQATRNGRVYGIKQRVYKDPVTGWTWTDSANEQTPDPAAQIRRSFAYLIRTYGGGHAQADYTLAGPSRGKP